MKVKDIVAAYKALGEARTSTLNIEDVLVIVKARRAMRPIVDDYEAFVKDVLEKAKPADFDKLVEIERRLDTATQEEKEYHLKGVVAYRAACSNACDEEFAKEVNIDLGKLSQEVQVKLLKENGWSVAKLDELAIMIE